VLGAPSCCPKCYVSPAVTTLQSTNQTIDFIIFRTIQSCPAAPFIPIDFVDLIGFARFFGPPLVHMGGPHMVKAMPGPYKPPHSSVYWYRQRAPKDVAGVVKGRSVSVVVDGVTRPLKIGTDLKVSLRTKDPSEAKVRARDMQSQFDLIWASFRSDEVTLNLKQAVALAGEVYRDFKVFEDSNAYTYWQCDKLRSMVCGDESGQA
jgi:hypothetical protein